jgi:DNA-binding response OmpR family regulator
MNGEEGLKAVLEFAPDVILLDIMMPGMDGWQVLEKLQQNADTKRIPVVVFTAREYSNGKAMAVEKGAVDFVAKPFEPRELVATLEKIIARDKE